MKELFVYPGDKLASIEEFEGEEGTYEDNGDIRANLIGKAVYDFKNRIIRVIPLTNNITIKPGDIVLGFITMVAPMMLEMRILCINDNKQVNLSAIYFSKSKKDTQFKVGDIVRAKVTNILNSFIHVTFNDKRLGVVYTRCHICGGEVIRINDGIKCKECNTKSDRKLAEDFDNVKGLLPCYRGI